MIVVVNYKFLNVVRRLKAAAWRDLWWENQPQPKLAQLVKLWLSNSVDFICWISDAKEYCVNFSGVAFLAHVQAVYLVGM